MISIESALQKAAQMLERDSCSPRLEAELLLAQAIDKPRSHLRAWPERPLAIDYAENFWSLIRERQRGMPIAYLVGQREFWSRPFQVTADVLIPRPETELLIELCLPLIPAVRPFKLIDLGTGSGIIAVTLASERPLAEVVASDISMPALNIAKLNAEKHRVGNIRFLLSDWFAHIDKSVFDLIVSNPPYIAEDDSHLSQGDLRFEPKSSLCSAQQGLADIRHIVRESRKHLAVGGHLLIEHGYNQKQAVQKLFKELSYESVQTYNDLSGNPRVTYGRFAANQDHRQTES